MNDLEIRLIAAALPESRNDTTFDPSDAIRVGQSAAFAVGCLQDPENPLRNYALGQFMAALVSRAAAADGTRELDQAEIERLAGSARAVADELFAERAPVEAPKSAMERMLEVATRDGEEVERQAEEFRRAERERVAARTAPVAPAAPPADFELEEPPEPNAQPRRRRQ